MMSTKICIKYCLPYLIIDPVLLNSVAGSESALLWVGGGGGVDWREEVDRWDWGVEHIFRTFARKPSKTCKKFISMIYIHLHNKELSFVFLFSPLKL